MDEPGGGTRRSKAGQAAAGSDGDHRPTDGGDTVEFGGLPIRWPFGEASVLGRLRGYLTGVVVARNAVVMATLIVLVVGLLIGFGVGHFTAPTSHKVAERPTPNPGVGRAVFHQIFATDAIQPTGQQCALQLGKNLLIGIEIENTSNFTITVHQVIPEFPLGGLHTIEIEYGVCGELPAVIPITTLGPGSTEWITATVAVRVKCPEPLPVWFKVRYSRAGRSEEIVIQAFPDLGQVSYGNCATTSSLDARFSAISTDAVETP
jgi:hypothetical protein